MMLPGYRSERRQEYRKIAEIAAERFDNLRDTPVPGRLLNTRLDTIHVGFSLAMNRLTFRHFALTLAIVFATAATTRAADTPEGFRPLFNGTDLEGWHGMPHFDPRKLAEMSEEERTAKMAMWDEDMKANWTIENG